jgi:hypothetical protein
VKVATFSIRKAVCKKIKIYETFGYFQTGFAKVVEDMMKEQKSTASKQLLELNSREEYLNTPEFAAGARLKWEKRARLPLGDGVWGLGFYLTSDNKFVPYTMDERIEGERKGEMWDIEQQRAVVAAELKRDIKRRCAY